MKDLLHVHDYKPVDVRYLPDRVERVFECQCGDCRMMTYKCTAEELKGVLTDDCSR